MNRPYRQGCPPLGWLCSVLLGAAVVGVGPSWAAAPQTVWELTPYRVRVVLSFQRAAELTPVLKADLRTGLVNHADLLIGAPWEVSLASAPAPLDEQMMADLQSVTVESLPPEWLANDKVALLTVSVDLEGYQVDGRELDVRTRRWSPLIRATAYHPAKLGDTLFWVLHRVFAPLAQIESVENESAVLRLRAGELPPRDPTCMVTAPGNVFQPILRYNDREGKPRRVTPVIWTYFVVGQANKAQLKCKLHTGIRNPLSSQRRGRVEQLALAILPRSGPTRLVLRSRTDKSKPLSGYEIYRQQGDSKNTAYLGRTDRRGSILLEPGTDASLRILVIKSGNEVLARLPLVLGLDPEVVAPVSDDDQRLEAEGFLAGFQENLVDLVTRRQVVQAQFRARIQARKYDEAERLLTTFRQLKGRDECLNDLNREKQKIFSKDTVVQRKIDKLFSDTQTLLGRYLDSADIERLVRELAEARKGKVNPSTSAAPAIQPAGNVSGATGISTTPASPTPPNSSVTRRG